MATKVRFSQNKADGEGRTELMVRLTNADSRWAIEAMLKHFDLSLIVVNYARKKIMYTLVPLPGVRNILSLQTLGKLSLASWLHAEASLPCLPWFCGRSLRGRRSKNHITRVNSKIHKYILFTVHSSIINSLSFEIFLFLYLLLDPILPPLLLIQSFHWASAQESKAKQTSVVEV